jgi:hypothetical protein
MILEAGPMISAGSTQRNPEFVRIIFAKRTTVFQNQVFPLKNIPHA